MAFNFSLQNISLTGMAVNFFYASVVIGVLAIAGLYWFQGSLIYMANYPDGSRQKMIKPNAYNLPFEDIVITTPDGIRIGAYLIKRETDEQTSKAPTLIYFHANAGNMGHRIPISEVIHRVCHCNILMLSYRGYGYSEGSPTEKGLKIDAQAALDFVLKHPLLKDNPIVVYGQSLGGAVAIHVAATNQSKVKAIILENTFLSIPKLLPNVFPTLKFFTKLCHQIWDSEGAIASIESIPTLFISGLKDELIPPTQMKKLFDTMPNQTTKVWKEIPDGNHNDTCTKPGYFQAIEAFFVEYIHKNK